MLKGKGKSLVLILALVAVLALVGCGSPKTKVSADEVVQDALAAQAGVTSSHVEITINATAKGTANGTAWTSPWMGQSTVMSTGRTRR